MNDRIRRAWDNALQRLNPSKAQLERGLELHRESIVIDAYGFAPYTMPANAAQTMQVEYEQGGNHNDLFERYLSLRIIGKVADEAARDEFQQVFDHTGVTCIGQNAGEGRNMFESLERMSLFTHVCDELPNIITKAVTAGDIERAKRESRHCLYFSLNNPIMHQAWDYWRQEMYPLEIFRNAGIRMMHLTYNRRNRAGDGCAEPGNAGLSDFGIDIVREMNRLQIIVDLAHTGWQSCLDACRASRQPVVVSHAAVHAIGGHIRGKPDDVIDAVVKTGGYIGMVLIPTFLGGSGDIVALLDSIDYVAKKWGPDHAAIGSDVAYAPPQPQEITDLFTGMKSKRSFWSHWPADEPLMRPGGHNDDCSLDHGGTLCWTNWPLFTVGMVQRGYSDDDIRKIVGGNVLRVMRDVCG